MRATRVSIAGLMGFVLFVGLGFGGLKAANPLWASICFTSAFAALIAGVLFAMQSRGRQRAFWAGFSVAGWAYFSFVFLYSAALRNNFETPPLLTTVLLDRVEALFFPPESSPTMPGATSPFEPAVTPASPLPTPTPAALVSPSNSPFGGASNVSYYQMYLPRQMYSPGPESAPLCYRQVGQCMATLLLAYAGGLFSSLLASRRLRGESAASTLVDPSAA